MGSRYHDKKPTKAIEEKIIFLFYQRERYLLPGEIALALNQNLDYILYVIEYLEEKAVIRKLSKEEKSIIGLHSIAEAYVLNKDNILKEI
jgi:hypothetical protein